MPVNFATFFHAATGLRLNGEATAPPAGHAPYDYQRRLAGGEPSQISDAAFPIAPAFAGACESRLISIPTGLGKTAAIVLSRLWNRVVCSQISDPASGMRAMRTPWPRRVVYCLPTRTLALSLSTQGFDESLALDVRADPKPVSGIASHVCQCAMAPINPRAPRMVRIRPPKAVGFACPLLYFRMKRAIRRPKSRVGNALHRWDESGRLRYPRPARGQGNRARPIPSRLRSVRPIADCAARRTIAPALRSRPSAAAQWPLRFPERCSRRKSWFNEAALAS